MTRSIIYYTRMDLFDLDIPLLDLVSKYERNSWTARHAVEGVQIFGGIGSGKTSGSGRTDQASISSATKRKDGEKGKRTLKCLRYV